MRDYLQKISFMITMNIRLVNVVLVSLLMFFVHGFVFPSVAFAEDSDALEPFQVDLQVPIPGFDYSGGVIYGGDVGKTVNNVHCPANSFCITTLIDYLNAVYKYLLGAGVIFAIVMIMIGGIEWMVGSSVGKTDKAKKHIKGAISGLFILFFINIVLAFINPNITDESSIIVAGVPRSEDISKVEHKGFVYGHNTPVKTEALDADGNRQRIEGITGLGGISSAGVLVHSDITLKLQGVSESLASTSPGEEVVLDVAEGYREPGHQAAIFYKNCVLGSCLGDKATCNVFPEGPNSPFERKPNSDSQWQLTSQAKKNIGSTDYDSVKPYIQQLADTQNTFSCPEVTGYGVKVFPGGGVTQGFTTTLKYQLKLEEFMKRAGFCRSYYDPWKYEFKGHVVEDSTQCDWKIGTKLMIEEDRCAGSQYESSKSVEYATGKSSKCAVDYSDACASNYGDKISLISGKCISPSMNASGSYR